MARKKMNAFTADDAKDSFTPTVKTLKTADVAVEEVTKAPADAAGKKPVPSDHDLQQKKERAKTKTKVKSKGTEETQVQEKRQTRDSTINKLLNKEVQDEPSADVVQAPTGESIRDFDEDRGTETLIQLVGFCLGNEEYGFEIQRVQEINRIVEITHVPRTPDFVMGVINLRGKVIPVINLRERFGLPSKEADKDTRIVVVEIQNKILGIMVDAVSEVLRIPASTIEPPPDIVTGVDAEYIEGIAKLPERLLILLDLDKILSSEQIDRIEDVA